MKWNWSAVFGTSAILCAWLYLNGGREAFLEHTRGLFEQLPAVNVTVYNNGLSTDGLAMQINRQQFSSDGEAFAAYLSTFVKVSVYGKEQDNHVADRVYTGAGLLVQQFADLSDADRLYLVAPGLLFVWPFVSIGHKVFVEASNSPLDQPMVLESFTDSPRTFIIHNFFSHPEADALIQRILEIDDKDSKLQQSHVGHQSGAKRVSAKRTSENAFDQVSVPAVAVRKRSFDLLNIGPYEKDMCDGLQLLRYKQKQAYVPHTDYFDLTTAADFNWNPADNGSNRFATVFLYLSNVTLGGQTVFPKADLPADAAEEYQHQEEVQKRSSELIDTLFEKDSWEHEMANQCLNKLAVYPVKGRAILFYSQKGNGEMDPMSLHGGCPNLSEEDDANGIKWAANLWVWNKRRFGLDPLQSGVASTSISVDFQNPNDYNVDVYWASTLMTTIAPHGSINYKSYDGHKWSFKVGEDVILEHEMDKEAGAYQKIIATPAVTDDAVESVESAQPVDLKEEL